MICSHEESIIVLEPADYQLRRCLSCGLIFSRPAELREPDSPGLYDNYYKPETANRFGLAVETAVKAFRFLRARGIARSNPRAKSILDIGSGRGWLLFFLKKYFNYETAVGTQIAANAYKFSKEKLKLEIYNQDLLDISFSKKFEVVSILHVLEHVAQPEQYLSRISELLNSRGSLLIEVPNYQAWSRKLSGRHWLALDLKHHLFFFTPAVLVSLLKKYNFKILSLRTFSWEYSTFTSAQSLVNLLTGSDSYFFAWLQDRKFQPKIIWHALLFVSLFLPCLLINLFLYFSKNGEVITISAQKND